VQNSSDPTSRPTLYPFVPYCDGFASLLRAVRLPHRVFRSAERTSEAVAVQSKRAV
jgi:hypothetical protein